MEQLLLLLRDSKKKASFDSIAAQPTFKEALKLCKGISGFDDKLICAELDIDAAQWSRIFGNGGHFPENKLIRYMQACQNVVPLIWLALKMGYTISPLKNELELENERLRQALSDKEKELEVIRRWEAGKR